MDIFKNKLFLALLLAVAITAISYWYQRPGQLSQKQVLSWIMLSHSQQFCNVIYPRIQHCVTLKQPECLDIAKKQITNCVNLSQKDIPKRINRLQAKEIYEINTGCFQDKMQMELLHNYVIKTSECQRQLS